MNVAVVAHSGKSVGGGLDQLRAVLARRGVEHPLWFEVDKSRKVPAKVAKALDKGADLVVVWGGDGTVQRAVDTIAGTDATLAVVPAGTANLFASNLGIPADVEQAVEIALSGVHRRLDVGAMNGERFAVMAGVEVFPDARPDDGALELGVLSARGAWQWTRLLARAAVGHVERSSLVQTTAGRRIEVRLGSKRPYELDGGARKKTDRLKVKVLPGALNVAVPAVAA